jgi:hypothetical protein
MLALQGTLTVPSFYGISSSMDDHALESGHASPSGSGSMGWRMRAPTSRYQPQLPPEEADLGSTGLSGECSILRPVPRSSGLLQYRAFPNQGSS